MKLFVSYRSTNSDRVDSIVIRLRSLKGERNQPRYSVWQDKDSIPPGKDWWEAIVDAIIDCDVFIFMVSRESVQSTPCRAELSYARKRNRPIIPIVLEGEFNYNTTTGKNDIRYWEHIPEELLDGRAQFLFYEGVSFVHQLETAFDHIRHNPLRDIPAPRPPDPRPAAEANSDASALYDQACDYAFRLEFNSAERLFQRLANANDPDFGQEAYDWIVILRDYDQMLRWDARETTRYKVQAKWQTYLRQFPKAFTPLFDPKHFQARYSDSEDKAGDKTVPPASNSEDVTPPAPRVLKPDEHRRTSGDMFAKGAGQKPSIIVPSFTLPLLEWINIPAGRVTLGKPGEFIVAPFAIAKYPVTNAQYQAFISDEGYETDQWWQGLAERFTEPDTPNWTTDNHPRERVNWYEAVAFCRWLSSKVEQAVTLPTEMQWQWAAQGDEGREYPWGRSFDTAKCNTEESGIGQTTPVDRYPQGQSPYGVTDMSGNVWEWTLTDYNSRNSEDLSNDKRRGVRGGSFLNSGYDARAASRDDFRPAIRRNNFGFRVVSLGPS